jgi:hypothetical protein
MLPSNVGRALSIYNPSLASTFGLGYARFTAPHDFADRLRLVPNRDLHWDVDNDEGVHGLILRDLQRLAEKPPGERVPLNRFRFRCCDCDFSATERHSLFLA